ncbi:chemotaxis protein CheA [Cohnella panacarvi]|uniref:chemotaxis protein CheA n=1 Tax=Cohnella panacarvi TaxID=400776 RepID=UPI00047C0F23|nr:chemotaxis protein CheA [Cohnella panacarvi]
MDNYLDRSIIEMFFFESEQLIEQIDRAVLLAEKAGDYSPELVNEILRAMHTIKGSAATMKYSNIAELAHALEDVLHYLREHKPRHVDNSELTDLVLEGSDLIKVELHKLKNGDRNDGDTTDIIVRVRDFLARLDPDNAVGAGISQTEELAEDPAQATFSSRSKSYFAHLVFDDSSGMENLRAFTVAHHLGEMADDCRYEPSDIAVNESSADVIRSEGFRIWFRSAATDEELHQFFSRASYLRSFELSLIEEADTSTDGEANGNGALRASPDINGPPSGDIAPPARQLEREDQTNIQQSIISVHVSKLDKLMDLVGELVISEAMVTQNPDLRGLSLENFMKSARHLRKITSEIQDMVMSIRMVPLTATFHKMYRIVRDVSKKLGKDVQLRLIGEETEVDKNIIERISDPLMHIIRNAIDHGIEMPEDRIRAGKDKAGTITLEARNVGSDVFIAIRDDGGGLDKARILDKARRNGLLHRPAQEMTDKEIYAMIFLPGFSTKEKVSEFSGRGVGMDVVVSNIEAVGGSVWVESEQGAGSDVYFKIPLTLAIIDGMNIRVGHSRFTIPITAIKESFRPTDKDLIRDPNGYEMIMVRGQCYPIVRLHDRFGTDGAKRDLTAGIMIMVESETSTYCLFADELIGEQQVVVKSLPEYIRAYKKISGLAGCTLLGDGSISLILDVERLR